jgi:hypothetical protein
MNHSYQSITTAAIEAIEAMVSEPRDTSICDASSVRAVASRVYWSWAQLVGDAARQEDSDKMIRMISEMARPSPRFGDEPFRLSRPT